MTAKHGVKVGVFPACRCEVAELPLCGPLSHGVALARVLLRFVALTRAGALSCAVPGVMQICDPAGRKITFLCPQEKRQDMLVFALQDACRPHGHYP